MKIGIFTLPIHHNLGGILQNYALQKVLEKMGHEVYTINRRNKENTPVLTKLLSFLKRVAINIIYNKKEVVRTWQTTKENQLIFGKINNFIKNNIKLTKSIKSTKKLRLLKKNNFDAYIVGSDQVWRPKYSPNIIDYYLGFLGDKKSVKRIAYSASFGVENWEYSKEETRTCKDLANKFDAISVREDSAVYLVKEKYGIDAFHVLDPVLLLTKEEYLNLIAPTKNTANINGLFNYILDETKLKTELAKKISLDLNLNQYSILPQNCFEDVGRKRIQTCIKPSISDWIHSFSVADFVVTDSFHGLVLSILFNKQFICIGNHSRGLTRFTSLLSKLGLSERLILDGGKPLLNIKLNKINYNIVNELLEKEKENSLSFLKKTLQVD